MIGTAFRLAGKLPSLLMKPGIGGQLARGVGEAAAVTGAFAAAPTAYDLVTGDLKKSTEKEIIKRGKDEDGYQMNFGDHLKSILTGGIDEKSLDDRQGSMNFQEINDPKNAAIKADLQKYAGVDLSKAGRGTENIDALSAEFSGKIAKGKRKDEFDEKVELADLLDQRRRSSPEAIRERAIADEARDFRRQSAIDSRNDQLLARQQSLDLGMAQLNAQSARDNRQFDYNDRMLDYNMKARKAERMQKIAMALGGLGSLFAA